MKKPLTLSIITMLMISLLAGCAPTAAVAPAAPSSPDASSPASPPAPAPAAPEAPDEEPVPGNIRIGGLRGPGGMGMVKLLEDAEKGLTRNTYEYIYGASPEELTPKFLQGELDIISIPANIGAVIYHNTNGGAKVVAITARGIMYVLEKGGEMIQTVADLKGQEMYSTGKGSSVEFALRYIFEQNGLDPNNDVDVDWRIDPTEIIAAMVASDHSIAMLPQPFVTVALSQVQGLRVALDMTEEWDALDTDSQFLTTIWIVRSDFADSNPGAMDIFIEEFEESTNYVNANPAEGAALIEKYGIIAAPVAERAIPYCNLSAISGTDMKRIMGSYLEVLHDQAPAAVGGTLPGDDFYYGA